VFGEAQGSRLAGETTADDKGVECLHYSIRSVDCGAKYSTLARLQPVTKRHKFVVSSAGQRKGLRYTGSTTITIGPQGMNAMSEREIDQVLVEQAQGGDQRAFDQLVGKYQRKLGRLLSRMIRDAAEVEDVTQEAFIKAYRALPSFRGDSAFYTWLYRIGINTAKNYLVSQGRRAPTSTEFDADEAETFEDATQLRDINTPESLLLSKQIGQTVNAAMEALPEELRTAIVLREIEGLSYEEIAGIMDCPIGTVRSRIFRAREAVAGKLRPLLDTSPDRRW